MHVCVYARARVVAINEQPEVLAKQRNALNVKYERTAVPNEMRTHRLRGDGGGGRECGRANRRDRSCITGIAAALAATNAVTAAGRGSRLSPRASRACAPAPTPRRPRLGVGSRDSFFDRLPTPVSRPPPPPVFRVIVRAYVYACMHVFMSIYMFTYTGVCSKNSLLPSVALYEFRCTTPPRRANE